MDVLDDVETQYVILHCFRSLQDVINRFEGDAPNNDNIPLVDTIKLDDTDPSKLGGFGFEQGRRDPISDPIRLLNIALLI